MSRLYFHSPRGDAELNGSEYVWLGSLAYDIAVGVMDLRSVTSVDRLRELIAPDHYMADQPVIPRRDGPTWACSFETAFRVGNVLAYEGQPIDSLSLALNTALLLGNDQIKLAARLYGQSGIYAYIEGPNRVWAADIIDRGLETSLYRKGLLVQLGVHVPREQWPWRAQGWEDVIALLRACDDEPVVTSYSGATGPFPCREALGAFPPRSAGWRLEDWSEQEWAELDDASMGEYWETAVCDEWGRLPVERQWAEGMEALRTVDQGLEIGPDHWDDVRFTHGLSAFDLYADDWRERLEAALGLVHEDA